MIARSKPCPTHCAFRPAIKVSLFGDFDCTSLCRPKGHRSPKPPPAKNAAGATWQSLFDGKTLGKWKATDFGGQGESVVEDGNLLLTHGEPLTGVTWQGEPPFKMNYEIELDAQRVDGSDFFCALTFPVDKTCASLIVGGWGGALCGISNLDDNDAANNETTKIRDFKNKQWYHIRMRVEPEHLAAWIDDEQIVGREYNRPQNQRPRGGRRQPAAGHRLLPKHRRDQKHPDASPPGPRGNPEEIMLSALHDSVLLSGFANRPTSGIANPY